MNLKYGNALIIELIRKILFIFVANILAYFDSFSIHTAVAASIKIERKKVEAWIIDICKSRSIRHIKLEKKWENFP